jgi:5-deoxy-glucuronate isomerase
MPEPMADRGRGRPAADGQVIDTARLHLPLGTAGDGPYPVAITPERAGWGHAGLRILELRAGEEHSFECGADEVVVLPLSGSCRVDCDGQRFELAGRDNVLTALSDFAYAPLGSSVTVFSERGGRFALPSARSRRRLAPRYMAASEVEVELRGAGSCSRQVNNFCTPGVFEADRMIACELLTPAGNWSSYPPHKHDEEGPGETALEEIYYFEVGAGPSGPGLAYQRVYGTADRPLDVLAEVRSGDVVLVPHGWHGPSMAAPGYDLYYLNVMAGPGEERAWLISDDPTHGWVRESWRGQQVDPRLPMARAAGVSP